ncbi:Nif3-like dinuclear metal center hexameric protein [Marinobacterium rhizophilum]|uniref:Nif3-like dinuclear metal center hexameric protein n=1 Tax=Marinobacterium rhizophilum TaxID=420402 RepID=UPI00036B60AB|nr:Nif3-like dinuclear metal center hexameric protein [Marinobacterium rhizophilum]
MSIELNELVRYCDTLLQSNSISDYCPNGLQVEGRSQVKRILCGVTASQALLDEAVAWQADLVLVHHGYFWKGEDSRIRGVKKRRLATLLKHDISLLAYHLPLDVHPVYGNNVQLAARLGLAIEGSLEPGNPRAVGLAGRLDTPLTLTEFAARIEAVLGREPLCIKGGEQPVERIGWCTGAAQGYIEQAAELGLDAYLSGEISEPTVHSAREHGVHYIAAGHHATERYGVQSLGEHLAQHFGLQWRFADIDNPV